jgi:crotonobetainyl-CoA:carnitine CoA-transferase CaiB-like acyl-CoA transferase
VSAIDYVSGYLMAFGAMVALARRAQEGGSWLVRVALARVGGWIVERGVLPDSSWRGLAEELAAEELAPLLAEMDTPLGKIRHLRPVVQLSETPAYWSRPPVPLDYHAAAWPPRA